MSFVFSWLCRPDSAFTDERGFEFHRCESVSICGFFETGFLMAIDNTEPWRHTCRNKTVIAKLVSFFRAVAKAPEPLSSGEVSSAFVRFQTEVGQLPAKVRLCDIEIDSAGRSA